MIKKEIDIMTRGILTPARMFLETLDDAELARFPVTEDEKIEVSDDLHRLFGSNRDILFGSLISSL